MSSMTIQEPSGGGVDVYESGVSVVPGATRHDYKDLNVENPSGSIAAIYLDIPSIFDFRLSTESGLAPFTVSTADRTSQGNLYLYPYRGKKLSLYDGTRWKVYSSNEISHAISCTLGYCYDEFVYDNAGTLTMESAEWDNGTVTITNASPGVVTWNSHGQANGDRVILSTTGALPTGLTAGSTYFVSNKTANTFELSATLGGASINTSSAGSGTHTAHSTSTHAANLATQDGVYVKAGATNKRYVGAWRATGTNTTEDSGLSTYPARRFVSNIHNLVRRPLYVHDSTNTWPYTTAAFQQRNNSDLNQAMVLAPLPGLMNIDLTDIAFCTNSNATIVAVSNGIGRNSTTAIATNSLAGRASTAASMPASNLVARLNEMVPQGAHYYASLEFSNATGTTTWQGDNGVTNIKTGMIGWVDN